MTPFRAALTQLSQLSVAGVVHNYDVDAVPEALSRGQLPALLVLPIDAEDRSFNERGEAFRAIAFSSGSRTAAVAVTHLLIVAPAGSGKGFRAHLPGLIDLIDSYFTALSANLRLNDTLPEPARVRVEPGLFSVGEVEYIGCAFRHSWLLKFG